MTFRRFAALVGVTVALAATAGCSGRSAAHKAEHEIFNAIEFADVESVVSTKDLADEVEYVFHATPSFEVTESITPPDGWRFEEAFDRRESFEGDAQLFYFGARAIGGLLRLLLQSRHEARRLAGRSPRELRFHRVRLIPGIAEFGQ